MKGDKNQIKKGEKAIKHSVKKVKKGWKKTLTKM
jgi:hypothetical protein